MTTGLILTALTLGIRHGVDWDHIAAIADLSGTAPNRRRGFVLSFIYACGHAVVVLALGALAIIVGASLPVGTDVWMGRVVGLTLIALGLWIVTELMRKGRNFRLRSRWILVLNGTFAGLRRVREASTGRRRVAVDHDHDHEHVAGSGPASQAHDHAHETSAQQAVAAQVPVLVGAAPPSRWSILRPGRVHRHAHHHELLLGENPNAHAGNGTAAGIGMLHGIGIESPTQIAVFVASTSVVGATSGVALLIAWVAGLIIANSALAVLAGFGLLHAERNFTVYATIAVLVGAASITMGALLLFPSVL